MNSTTVRARLLVVLAMIASTFSVALVAESATAARAYFVNVTVSDTTPDVGDVLRVSGKVTPAAPGKRVEVQARAAGTGWLTLARPRLSRTSTYKYAVQLNRAGRIEIRVVKPRSRNIAKGVSRIRALRIGQQNAPVITTTSLPAGAVGTAYSAVVETADGRPGEFTIGAGSLPAGLALDDQRGTITGTPTAQGTSTFTVVFRDPDGRADAQELSITVGPAGSTPPVITTTTLPNGQVGAAYTTQLQTAGNQTGTWSVASGALPPGLTGNPSTGVISGTPTTAGTYNFTARFTQTSNGLTDTQALSITISAAGAPVISTTSLPSGAVAAPYSAQLQTVGNRTGTWQRTAGTLPPGLTLDSATGVISGTPTTQGTSNFTVRFTQTSNGLTDTQPLSIAVATAVAPKISTPSPLPSGTIGSPYSLTLQTEGNKTGTWQRTAGALPPGLAVNTAGVISGTPTATGTYSFTMRFRQTGGLSDSKAFTLTIANSAAPVITTTTLPNGTVGSAYDATLQTQGNLTGGAWSVSGGTLPGGLVLNGATGAITGTPTAAGVTNFSVLYTAANGLTDTQALSITVAAAT